MSVTATAAPFASMTSTISVLDNDVHHFGFTPITATQTTNIPFYVSITAYDIANSVISSFNGGATLSAAGDGGAVTISPTATTAFWNGYWSSNVTLTQAGTNVRLTARSAMRPAAAIL